MFAGLLEQRDEPFDFSHRIFVGLGRAGCILDHGIDQDRDASGRRGRKSAVRSAIRKYIAGVPSSSTRRTRHDRLDVVDELVADEPDGAPVNRGRPGTGTGRNFFMTRSTTSNPSRTRVAMLIRAGAAGAATVELLRPTLPFSRTATRSPVLADNGARVASDERIASEVFAAFDRFEEKGLARARGFSGRRKGGSRYRPASGV